MSEADKSKNLHWLVVGARGEKRLIKSIRREQEGGREERRGGWRGGLSRGGPSRGRASMAGRGRGLTRGRGGVRTSGANNMPLGARAKAPAVPEQRGLDVAEREERETESETEENEMEVEGESARDNPPTGERRKRKERNEHGVTVGPPEKR
jgi:hypothetical protein